MWRIKIKELYRLCRVLLPRLESEAAIIFSVAGWSIPYKNSMLSLALQQFNSWLALCIIYPK